MAKISEECIKEAFTALKNFSKDELKDYVRNVFARAKDYDPLQGQRSIDRAIREINDEGKQSLFSDASRKANNLRKFSLNSDPIKNGLADMRGVLAGRKLKGSYYKRTEKDSDWRKRNIPDAVKAEYEKIIDRTLGDLTHEEVEHFSSGKFDEIICDIYDGKKIDDPVSQKIADKMKDYFDYAKSELILSDAMGVGEFNERRYFGAVHDQQKVVNGNRSWTKMATDKTRKAYDSKENRSAWRNTIKRFIDMTDTFKKTDAGDLNGDIDMAQADKIIDRTFNNISTGKSDIFTRSTVVNDAEAVARKSKMFFVWKDLRSQYEYNKIYGRGNLFHMLMADAQSSASKIGTAKMWGDNPYSMYADLRKVQDEVNPKGGKWWEHTDNYFKSVMGLDRLTSSPNAVNFFSNLRTLSTMARLPLITLDSISDIGYQSSFAQRIGINYFEAYGHHLKHLFDMIPTENRKAVARLMRTQVNSELGYLGRWTEQQSVTESLNKISSRFFKLNMLDAFDRGTKTGNMTLMGESLYMHSGKSWDKLPEPTRKYLDRFIDAKEWDLLRKKNNGQFFSTDNVQKLTSNEIKTHHEKTDKSIPLSEMQDDLYRRVYAMFLTTAENTVLTPGDFERAFLYQGTNPGSTPGIILRSFAQFKMYALSYIDRVLIDGLRGADTVQQKIMWATAMMMGTLPLAYATKFLKNAAMGLSMPKWDEMNVPQREKYMLELLQPSLGIFSGLLDPRNQNSSLIFSLLGSPSLSLISNAISAPMALFGDHPGDIGKRLVKAMNYMAPIQTTPIISPIIRQAMGDEAHLEPGQEHYFGR